MDLEIYQTLLERFRNAGLRASLVNQNNPNQLGIKLIHPNQSDLWVEVKNTANNGLDLFVIDRNHMIECERLENAVHGQSIQWTVGNQGVRRYCSQGHQLNAHTANQSEFVYQTMIAIYQNLLELVNV